MENEIDRDCEKRSHRGFRHILPFLAVPLAFGVMRGIAHYKYGHMGERRHGDWQNGVPPMFAELHRRAHAAEASAPSGTPAEDPANTPA